MKEEYNYNIIKSDNHIINHITSYIIYSNQLGQFHIITYFKVDFALIIYYMTYLILLTNFHN